MSMLWLVHAISVPMEQCCSAWSMDYGRMFWYNLCLLGNLWHLPV